MAISINDSTFLTTQTASCPAFNSSGINIFTPPGQHKHGMEVLLFPPTPAIGGCGFFGYQFKSTLPTSTWQHPCPPLINTGSSAPFVSFADLHRSQAGRINQLNHCLGVVTPVTSSELRHRLEHGRSNGGRVCSSSKGGSEGGTRVPRVHFSSKGAHTQQVKEVYIISERNINTTTKLQKSDNTIIVRQGCDDWADNPISWWTHSVRTFPVLLSRVHKVDRACAH